jgi:hypothetical protein
MRTTQACNLITVWLEIQAPCLRHSSQTCWQLLSRAVLCFAMMQVLSCHYLCHAEQEMARVSAPGSAMAASVVSQAMTERLLADPQKCAC